MFDRAALVFFSDNGAFPQQGGLNYARDGGHFRSGKGMHYEGGYRVPAFIKPPGLQTERGGSFPGLFHIVDLFPTILSMASAPSLYNASKFIKTAYGIDGIDLSWALTSPKGHHAALEAVMGDGEMPNDVSQCQTRYTVRTTAVLGVSTFQSSFALRSGRWKMIVGPAGDDHIYSEPVGGWLFGEALQRDDGRDRNPNNPPPSFIDLGSEMLGSVFSHAWGEDGGGSWFVVSFVAIRMLLRGLFSRHPAIALPTGTFAMNLSSAMNIASPPLKIVSGSGILPCTDKGL